MHLSLRPGTDGALAMALLCELQAQSADWAVFLAALGDVPVDAEAVARLRRAVAENDRDKRSQRETAIEALPSFVLDCRP